MIDGEAMTMKMTTVVAESGGPAFTPATVAAAVGNYIETRGLRKRSERYTATTTQKDFIDDLFLGLSVLGQRLLNLGVIITDDVGPAHRVVRQALTSNAPILLEALDGLETPLQYAITSATMFCSFCHPQNVYSSFTECVLGTIFRNENSLPAHHKNLVESQKWYWSQVNSWMEAVVALLASMLHGVTLFSKLPTGLSRSKSATHDGKALKQALKPYTELVKAIDKRGMPQPRDRSVRLNTYWIPSPSLEPSSNKDLFDINDGHEFSASLQNSVDVGRLLYAFTAGKALDLGTGDTMIVMPGPVEHLVRWLEGLNGTTFKLIHASEMFASHLKLGDSVSTLLFTNGAIPYYAVRIPDAQPKSGNDRSVARPSWYIAPTPHTVSDGWSRSVSSDLGTSMTASSSPGLSKETSNSARRAPPPPPRPPQYSSVRQVVAQFDFTAGQSNELSFRMGDVLDVLQEDPGDGWIDARLNGRTGAIPASYVRGV